MLATTMFALNLVFLAMGQAEPPPALFLPTPAQLALNAELLTLVLFTWHLTINPSTSPTLEHDTAC